MGTGIFLLYVVETRRPGARDKEEIETMFLIGNILILSMHIIINFLKNEIYILPELEDISPFNMNFVKNRTGRTSIARKNMILKFKKPLIR